MGNTNYFGAIVEKEISPLKISDLDDHSAILLKQDTTFLEEIISGDKSLYYYTSSENKKQFYIKTDNKYELLVYKKYLKNGNALEFKKYVGQLTLYLKDAKNISSYIQNTSYKREDLIRLFKKYYSALNKSFKAPKQREKLAFEFGVLAGVSISELRFGNPEIVPYVSNLDLDDSYNLSLGLYANIILPKGSKRWSIYNDLLFIKMNYEGQYYTANSEHYYRYYDTKLTYNYIKLTNMLRYKIPFQKNALFVNAGISNAIAFEKTNSATSTQKQYSTDKVTYGDAFSDRKLEQGIAIGLGFKINKFHIECRYEKTNGMVDLIMQDSKVKRLYLLFGYQF
ncbi:outer membrane beta-barrel protein [Marinifilum caeruleilacunae]|nr:outer membrane beta-barrel protein [Marinifilum caeruleilacunae]